MEPFDAWAEAHSITMKAEEVGTRPDATEWDKDASHFRVTITGPRGQHGTTYSQGSAYRRWNREGVRQARQYGAPHFNTPPKLGDRASRPYGSIPIGVAAIYDDGTEAIPPELGDVLCCLASDAQGVENTRSFEEWADDYGYDTDSRKAEASYRACQDQAAGLARALGEGVFGELLALEEEA